MAMDSLKMVSSVPQVKTPDAPPPISSPQSPVTSRVTKPPVQTPSLGEGDALTKTKGTDQNKQTSMTVVTDQKQEEQTQIKVVQQDSALQKLPPTVVEHDVVNQSKGIPLEPDNNIGDEVGEAENAHKGKETEVVKDTEKEDPAAKLKKEATQAEVNKILKLKPREQAGALDKLIAQADVKGLDKEMLISLREKNINSELPSVALAKASPEQLKEFVSAFKDVTKHDKGLVGIVGKTADVYKALDKLADTVSKFPDDPEKKLQAVKEAQSKLNIFLTDKSGSSKIGWMNVLNEKLGQMSTDVKKEVFGDIPKPTRLSPEEKQAVEKAFGLTGTAGLIGEIDRAITGGQSSVEVLNKKFKPATIKERLINEYCPKLDLLRSKPGDIQNFVDKFKEVTKSGPKDHQLDSVYTSLEGLKTPSLEGKLAAIDRVKKTITDLQLNPAEKDKATWLNILNENLNRMQADTKILIQNRKAIETTISKVPDKNIPEFVAQNPMGDFSWSIATMSEDSAKFLIADALRVNNYPEDAIKQQTDRIYSYAKNALPLQTVNEDQAILTENKEKENHVMSTGGDFRNLDAENAKNIPFKSITINGEVYNAPPAKVDAASSFGSVFIFTSDSGKKVVVKAFNDPRLSMPELDAHRKAGGTSKDPNVVEMKGVLQDGNGDKYLVMECADGKASLEDVFRTYRTHNSTVNPNVDMAVKLKSIIPMAKALEHVSQSGLIHADFRPGNFFMMQDGTPKLGDFGNGKPKSTYDVTFKEQDLFGNAAYFGPESTTTESRMGTFDESGDIYALGVSMVEILTNKTAMEIRDAGGPMAVLGSSNIPEEMKSICRSLLDPDPAQRKQAFSHVSERLDHVASTLPQVNTSKLIDLTNQTKELANMFLSPKAPDNEQDAAILEQYKALASKPENKEIIGFLTHNLNMSKSLSVAIDAVKSEGYFNKPENKGKTEALLAEIQRLADLTTPGQGIKTALATLSGH